MWPFASTVTVPAVGTGTFGSVTSPLPSVSVSVYDFPSASTRVTVAPPSTVTVTGSTSNSAVTVTSAAGIVKVLTFDEPATGTTAPPFVWLTFSPFSR